MNRELTLDQLRRIQATLTRRVIGRDPDNIRSVGFAPLDPRKKTSATDQTLELMAQFDVRKKRPQVSAAKRIEPIESVRLLDRSRQQFDSLQLITDVEPVGEAIPTGVRISTEAAFATTSLVVRWTTVRPVPPAPVDNAAEDPRWRWGVLTVSHLFVGNPSVQQSSARIGRQVACGAGPATVRGRVVVRGRIPGGPDVALVETGLDRLWLSGFLRHSSETPIAVAAARDLIRWTHGGTAGTLEVAGKSHHWKWKSFYPEFSIPGLGRLQHVVQYQWEYDGTGRTEEPNPFGPGASGGVLLADGIPIGIQVAAMQPDFRIGYAQSFDVSLPWLRQQLSATSLAIVSIVTGKSFGTGATLTDGNTI